MNKPALDPEIFSQMRELMDSALSEFIITYLGNTPKLIQQIDQALASGDNQTLAASAHQIKGGSGSIGALQIFELAKQIELAGREENVDGVDDLLSRLKTEYKRVEVELNEHL
jgi:HPt (histidine-containing phosphotransfer) domain-containing protein